MGVNCKNLFARYRFRSNFTPTDEGGFTRNELAFDNATMADALKMWE